MIDRNQLARALEAERALSTAPVSLNVTGGGDLYELSVPSCGSIGLKPSRPARTGITRRMLSVPSCGSIGLKRFGVREAARRHKLSVPSCGSIGLKQVFRYVGEQLPKPFSTLVRVNWIETGRQVHAAGEGPARLSVPSCGSIGLKHVWRRIVQRRSDCDFQYPRAGQLD